jgi:hypothetical protein
LGGGVADGENGEENREQELFHGRDCGGGSGGFNTKSDKEVCRVHKSRRLQAAA